MKKHAYLVMAHNNWGILKKQIELLDDPRNDFFIHIDKTVEFDAEYLLQNIKYSTIKFIERRNVYWADYTQTQVELDLIREAVANNNNNYSYLHLLSGVDLPVKTKEYIYDYFDGSDKIYMCCMTGNDSYQNIRTKYYYPFIHTRLFRKCKLLKGVSMILGRMQGLFGINRHKKKENYEKCYCGWTWFSIPQDFARFVLENEKKIYSTFHHTVASDESFMQTVAMNSSFKSRIYMLNSHSKAALRMIDWSRGKPYTFRMEDFELLMNSPYLFARKFDEGVDSAIIDKIYQEIKNQNKNKENL